MRCSQLILTSTFSAFFGWVGGEWGRGVGGGGGRGVKGRGRWGGVNFVYESTQRNNLQDNERMYDSCT